MKRTEKLKQNKKKIVVHERTKEEREPKVARKIVPFFALILLLGFFYLLFFSSAFKITKTEVKGYRDEELIEDIVNSQCSVNFYGSNILLFDSSKLEEKVREDSGVRKVSVKKKLPQTILVEIEESVPKLIWNTGGESLQIDDRGYVIGENNIKDLTEVNDSLNIEVSLGERVASPTFIKFIIDLDSNFKKIVGVEATQINIYDILSDVRVKSSDGWTVYLDAGRDPVAQLENLVRVLAEAEEDGHSRIEYIDMRLPDRVFYK